MQLHWHNGGDHYLPHLHHHHCLRCFYSLCNQRSINSLCEQMVEKITPYHQQAILSFRHKVEAALEECINRKGQLKSYYLLGRANASSDALVEWGRVVMKWLASRKSEPLVWRLAIPLTLVLERLQKWSLVWCGDRAGAVQGERSQQRGQCSFVPGRASTGSTTGKRDWAGASKGACHKEGWG